MKKRILGIILTICMVLTLIPTNELVKAEDNKNYSYYYVLGSKLINNGAGDERKPENRMIEVEPNVYELTAINVKKCEKQSFVFDNGTHYYIAGVADEYEISGETVDEQSCDIIAGEIHDRTLEDDNILLVSSPYEWADITYRLDLRDNIPRISVIITKSHQHIFTGVWETDSDYHWKKCGHTESSESESGASVCSQITKSAHTFELKCKNGSWWNECSVCGAKRNFLYTGNDYNVDSAHIQNCEAIERDYTYTGQDLGSTYTTESTTFKVWAPTAKAVCLNLYATGSDKEEGAQYLGKCDMYKVMEGDDWTGVWEVNLEGDQKNVYYTYAITTEKTTSENTTTTTIETQDIYSVATGVNGNRSMVCDLDSTDPDNWQDDRNVFVSKATDSLVWDINIKDFSYDASSGVDKDYRGKYQAFTENGTTLNGEGNISTCIDYLKELGVTTVKLNPFYDFNSVNESDSDKQYGLGNDPKNFNVPEGSYSSDPYNGNVRIKECKQMIQALHNAGISVVMDVDYTHTFSTNSSFQATVPNYYYRLDENNKFSDGTGFGNELATEREMYRKYIIQSILYWAKEYHIDGFNFNSMGLMDVETMNLIREALDNVDSRIATWGDSYACGDSYHSSQTCTGNQYLPATKKNANKLNSRYVLYNESLSDSLRGNEKSVEQSGFIQGADYVAPFIKYGVTAQSLNSGNWNPGTPKQTISYASRKDSISLYDKIIGSTTMLDYGTNNEVSVKMNKLAGSIVFMSQGIPLMQAGEEMCRSKDGMINNAGQSVDSSKINWENIVDYGDVVSYYKGLMQIRKHFSPLTCEDDSYKDSYIFNGEDSDATKQIAYTIANDTPGEWSKIAVIFNSDSAPANVTLKDTSTTKWVVIANNESAGVRKLAEVSGSTFSVPAYSALIAVEKISYESSAINDNMGRITVNYLFKDKDGKSKMKDSVVLQGTIGTGYQTSPDLGIRRSYIQKDVIGDEIGEFDKKNAVVTYVYEGETIHVMGNGNGNWLDGLDWTLESPKLTDKENALRIANRMTEVSPGVYEIAYSDIEKSDNYQVQFLSEMSQNKSLWFGSYVGSGVETQAKCLTYDPDELNLNYTTFNVPCEHANVKLKLDLTKYDYESKLGATFTITVVDPNKQDDTENPSEPNKSDNTGDENTENPSGTSVPKVGTTVKDSVGKVTYKVTSSSKLNPTVEFTAPVNKKAKSVTIPATVKINGITYKVTSIAKNAFKNNNKLTKVTIGKNITTIGDREFYKCTSLKKITIPSKISKIGKQAFYGCKKLKSITIKTTKLTSKKVGKQAFKGIYAKATIKVPKSKLKAYRKMLKAKGVGSKAKIKK